MSYSSYSRSASHYNTKKCIDCGRPMSWDEQRQQFSRAIKAYGLTPEEAKQAMPRCGKCTTERFSPWRPHVGAARAGQSSQ